VNDAALFCYEEVERERWTLDAYYSNRSEPVELAFAWVDDGDIVIEPGARAGGRVVWTGSVRLPNAARDLLRASKSERKLAMKFAMAAAVQGVR